MLKRISFLASLTATVKHHRFQSPTSLAIWSR